MPKRSKVSELPKPVRDWLEKAFVEGNFSEYRALSEACKARGYDISKSTLQREGSRLERRLAAIKTSTEAAKLIVASAQDNEDAKSEALIAITQHELFEGLNNLTEAAATEDAEARIVLVSKAAKGIADLVRASLAQKKFSQEQRRAVLAEAAEQATAAGKDAGLSDAAVEQIRNRIMMGVA